MNVKALLLLAILVFNRRVSKRFYRVDSIPIMANISLCAEWSFESQFTLPAPIGLDFDSNGTLFIAGGTQLYKLAPGSSSPSVVTGLNLPGSLPFQWACDVSTTIDGFLYVADILNRWVLIFPANSSTGTNLISNDTVPATVFVTRNGTIYVCDHWGDRVLRYSLENSTGVVVAGDGTPGNLPSQLSNPRGIYVDDQFNLYIADKFNHRIQKWPPGATSGVTVAGSQLNINGSDLALLDSPISVVVDSDGRIYVTDSGNNRIVRWLPNATTGTCIVSCSSSGNGGMGILSSPAGLKFDSHGNLFVTEYAMNRTQKFALLNSSSCGRFSYVSKRSSIVDLSLLHRHFIECHVYASPFNATTHHVWDVHLPQQLTRSRR